MNVWICLKSAKGVFGKRWWCHEKLQQNNCNCTFVITTLQLLSLRQNLHLSFGPLCHWRPCKTQTRDKGRYQGTTLAHFSLLNPSGLDVYNWWTTWFRFANTTFDFSYIQTHQYEFAASLLNCTWNLQIIFENPHIRSNRHSVHYHPITEIPFKESPARFPALAFNASIPLLNSTSTTTVVACTSTTVVHL